MRNSILLVIVFFSIVSFAQNEDAKMLKNIYETSLVNGESYSWLNHLSNQIGGRLSGSYNAEKAVKYTKEELDKLGLDRVWLQPVMVPKWVRGTKEYAYVQTAPGKSTVLPICALGGSVATPIGGLKAQLIEVTSFEELEQLGKEKIAGKIVFYNRPMQAELISTFQAYGGCVEQRYKGAEKAIAYGAVGVLVRSMNLRLDDYPHAGSMTYGDVALAKRIPAAAISTNGAELLSTMLKLDKNIEFYFSQHCKQLKDVQSYNVIGEITGSSYPNKVMVVGGHLDSWDLGDGAHDDGAGVVQSMEVLRLFKQTGYKPKHTIRVVLFMNEENGLRGGKKYAKIAAENKENHVFALESDAGGFTPRGFSFDCSDENFEKVTSWKSLFKPYLIHYFEKGGSGADIGPLKGDNVMCGLRPDSQRYFVHHHAANDTFEHVNKRELELGAATMASLVYLFDKYEVIQNSKLKK